MVVRFWWCGIWLESRKPSNEPDASLRDWMAEREWREDSPERHFERQRIEGGFSCDFVVVFGLTIQFCIGTIIDCI
jgi:hypothetical protein